jgi:hypothetical protein
LVPHIIIIVDPFWIVEAFFVLFLGGMGYMSLRSFRKQRRTLRSIASQIGFEDLRVRAVTVNNDLIGIWKDRKIMISIPYLDGVNWSIRLRIKTDLTGRFYLGRRTYPFSYHIFLRRIRHWISPPEKGLKNPDDNRTLYLRANNSDLVERLLSNTTSRLSILNHILNNKCDLVLEDGYLQVVRSTRLKLNTDDPFALGELEKIYRGQLELLQCVIAVLQPQLLHVEDRKAVI